MEHVENCTVEMLVMETTGRKIDKKTSKPRSKNCEILAVLEESGEEIRYKQQYAKSKLASWYLCFP
jgi:hypothetical protein